MSTPYRLPGGGYAPIIATSSAYATTAGTATTATTATKATNVAGGSANKVVVQTAADTTNFVTYSAGSGASTIMSRDSNDNTQINALCQKSGTVVTSGGTATLTSGSAPIRIFTGSSNHDLVLPDATTLIAGIRYEITNQSTGTITVKDNGANTLYTVAASSRCDIFLTSNGTTNGTWVKLNQAVVSELGEYATGTWTPIDDSGAGLTLTVAYARYTRVGNTVHVRAVITYPATADASGLKIGGLPFTVKSGVDSLGVVANTSGSLYLVAQANGGQTYLTLNAMQSTNAISNATASTILFNITMAYEI